MKNFIQAFGTVFILLFTFMFIGCGNENEPINDTDIPESGTDAAYNDLEWVTQSLVDRDADGNFIRYILGASLDAMHPESLTIGVDDIKDAENIFLSILPPGSENKLKISQDGGMTYQLTSEQGVAQGNISFLPDGEDNKIASIKFSEGAKIDKVSDISFILNSSWPDNSEFETSPYIVGDVVNFNTNEARDPGNHYEFEGIQKAIVIREATKDKCGLILYLSEKSTTLSASYSYRLLPTMPVAQEIAKIIGGAWDYWQARYARIGRNINQSDAFWIDKIKASAGTNWGRYAVKISDTNELRNYDWWDTKTRNPKRKYMLVLTFETKK